MRPTVGITVCIDRAERWPNRDTLYLSRAYAKAVSAAGAVPLLLAMDCPPEAAATLCDGVLLSGGDDLPTDPRALAEWCDAAAPRSSATLGAAEDLERIAWERQLLDACVAKGRPVLGVCYGMQLINLHFGGTLYRDVNAELPGAFDHGGSGRVTRHALERDGASALLAALPGGFEVNSSHGQAVRDVAPDFRVVGRAPDGVIEAIERPAVGGAGAVFGVEWHPETDPSGPLVYGAFVTTLRR